MQNMSINIKQRIISAEKLIGEKKLKPHKPGIIEYDSSLNPTKYYTDKKEFTEEELKTYMKQFGDQDGMTIFKPMKY